jgi:hypothetical protein
MSAPVTGIPLRLGVSLLALAMVSSCGGGGGQRRRWIGVGRCALLAQPDFHFRQLLPERSGATDADGRHGDGTLPEQFFIGAVDEGTAIDPEILVYLSGRQASFQITPRSGLAPGTHTGRLRLMACTTESCGKQIGNSPLFLPYTITVRQDLTVSPAQDYYTGQSGSEISVPLTVTHSRGRNHIPDRAHQPEQHLQHRGRHRRPCEPCCVRCLQAYSCTLRVTSKSPPARVVQRIFQFTVTPPPGGDHDISVTPSYFTQTTTEAPKVMRVK